MPKERNKADGYREYSLSLGTDMEEKLPFQKFKSGEGVLGYPPRDYQSRGFLPSTSWDTCSHSSTAMISLSSH